MENQKSPTELLYCPGKTTAIIYPPPSFKPKLMAPPPIEFNALTDEEYKQFQLVWVEFHQKHWPDSTIVVPKRKTREERQRERLV